MKKLLFLACTVFITNIVLAQLVQNSNFSNWQSENLYEYPEGWFIFNEDGKANQIAEKSNDASHGTHSIKLNTLIENNETYFGVSLYGIPGEGNFKGMPFDKTGDMFHFWYKSNIMPNDVALVMLILYKNGNVIDSVAYPVMFSQATWAYAMFPVNQTQQQPDSMFLAFISSLPDFWGGNPQHGTWLMVDNMYFTLGMNPTPLTVPNFSFENWADAIAENPVGWTSSNNEHYLIMNDTANVVKTIDYYSAPFAAKLTHIEIDGFGFKSELEYNQPFNASPEKLYVAYKFLPVGNDTAYISIDFLQNGNHVGGALIQFYDEQTTYLVIDENLNYYSTPDEIRIRIRGGDNIGTVLYIDDIRFSCSAAQNILGEFISSTSIQLNWLAGGSETQWQLEWGLQGFNQGNGTTVLVNTNPQYTLASISDVYNYDFYIRSICGAADTSTWIGPITVCKSISAPFSENFDTYQTHDFPTCWHKIEGGWAQTQVEFDGQTNSMALRMQYDGMNHSIVSLPKLQQNLNTLYIAFDAKKNWPQACHLEIGTMSNPSDVNTFNVLGSYVISSNNHNYAYYFNNYSGTDSYIAIRLSAQQGNGAEVFIDNIMVDFLPSCIPPQNVSASNITSNTAVITWNLGGQGLWDIIYGTYGFDPNTGGTSIYGHTSNTYNLNMLSSGTTYDVYVRSDCGNGDLSNWSKFVFNTMCTPFNTPIQEDFEGNYITDLPNCWHNIIEGWGMTYVTNWGGFNSQKAVNMRVNNYHDSVYLVTPEITSNLNLLFISFDAYKHTGEAEFTLGTLSNPNDPSTFNPLQVFILNSNYQAFQYLMSSYTGSDTYLAFQLKTPDQNYTEIFIDNIHITEAPTCVQPLNIDLINATETDINISWTASSGHDSWQVIHVLADDQNWQSQTPIVCNTPNYQASMLSMGTSYDFYVQAVCGVEMSQWSKVTFSTACAAFSIPINENFESTAQNNIPNCWHAIATHGASVDVINWHQSTSHPNSLRMMWHMNMSTSMFITPQINAPLSQLYISFNARANSGVSPIIAIGTMSDPQNENTFIPETTFNIDANFQTFSYDLSSYVGTNNHIAFKLYGAVDGHTEVFIDDIFIGIPPTCFTPTNININPSTTQAVVTWNPGGSETTWHLIYAYQWENDWLNNGILETITNNPTLTLQNLQPNHHYNVYLQADCGNGDLSSWSAPFSFQTPCASYNAPYNESFDMYNSWDIPHCWGNIIFHSDWQAKAGLEHISAYSQPAHVYLYNGLNPDPNGFLMMVTPEFLDVNTKQIRFYAKSNQDNTPLAIGHMDNISDPNSFNFITNINLTTNYAQYIVPLNGVNGDVHIAFSHGMSSLGNNREIFIDNFHFEPFSTCPQPSQLSVQNMSSTEVLAQWVENGNANTWQIEWGHQFFPLGTGIQFDVNTQSHLFFGLVPQTYYDYYVRSICGAGDTSSWSGPYTFYTGFSCASDAVYGQTPDPIEYLLWSATELNFKVLQSFSGINSIFDGLRVWGAQIFNNGTTFPECYNDPIDLKIDFYNDNTGSPGSLVTSFTVSVSPDSTYAVAGLGYQIYQYDIQFPQIIQLSDGWFSIQSTNSPSCHGLFINTTNPYAQGLALRVNANNDTVQFNPLGFCLINNTHTVNYIAGVGGQITGQLTQNVLHGATTTPVWAIADPCYEFSQWSDGSSTNPRTDGPVINDIFVNAEFSLRSIVSNDTVYICPGDTFYFGSQALIQPGTYPESFMSPEGCDSLVNLTLYFYQIYEFISNEAICSGDTYTWRGQNLSLAGVYYDSLNTINGCDSIFVLNLTVNPTFEFIQSEFICDGDIFTWRGNNYTIQGVYYDSLISVHNCDSVYVLNLTVNDKFEFIHVENICMGDTFTWRGVDYYSTGLYFDSLSTVHACDSVYVLDLRVNNHYSFVTDEEICHGQVFNWRGNDYNVQGTYYDSLSTQFGCDSIFILNLTVFDLPIVNISGLDTLYCVYHTPVVMIGSPSGGSFSGQGVVGNTFDPALAGLGSWIITYAFTDTNACFNTTALTVAVDACVGIESPLNQKIVLYPNPNDGHFFIDIFEDTHILLFNAIGTLVYSNSYEKGTHALGFPELPAGVYLLKTEGKNNKEVIRVVLMR